MKTKYFFLAAIGAITLASCSNDEFIGDNSPTLGQEGDGSIQFSYGVANTTRAGEFVGATAADKLGGMFVVEGTKGSEQTSSPSTTVVFDNYLVGYEYNSAGKTESNTNNWEYVGKQTGVKVGDKDRMTAATWTALHSTGAQVQSIKYWDYSVDQYDFIAWSTGTCEAVPIPEPAAAPTAGTVQVSRISKGNTLASNGFTLNAANATDLLQCYYTDINTVTKVSEKYGQPVTLTFKNLAAKVRIALYETVPGYSVKEVKFYNADPNPTAPTDLGSSTADHAYLFTMGADRLPQSGSVLVTYPHIGTEHRGTGPSYTDRTKDYNLASVTVTPGSTLETKQEFGALDYKSDRVKEGHEPDGSYLGYTLPTATFAGEKGNDYYAAVIPNTNGKPLTLRVDYTLVSTDGSNETITVKGAKAVVPSNFTVWQPNYAYTYIFKISDNSNGYTGSKNDPNGLFPITFDAVVASFVDANAEQKTITTVSTPSITTYQQGHDITKNEYNNKQKAGKDQANIKDLYVQVMKTDDSVQPLYTDLNGTKKSLLFAITKDAADYAASEAEVMDALQNRTNTYDAVSPIGRNGITLTKNDNIDNTVTSIVNGVDDQPITKIIDTNADDVIDPIVAGQVAKIDIDQLAAGTYAYVYSTTVPTADERIYNVVSSTEATAHPTQYYEVKLTASDGIANILTSGTAVADHVYFYKNLDEDNKFVSYTFKQTKVGESVVGLVDGGEIDPDDKADDHNVDTDTDKYFYFDVYNQNNGAYAVKVIKVVSVAMP